MDGVPNFFFTQGVLGVIVLVEAYIIIRLYNKTEKQTAEKEAVIEARRIDSKADTKEVLDVVSDFSQNIRVLTEKIEAGKQVEERSRR